MSIYMQNMTDVYSRVSKPLRTVVGRPEFESSARQ
jgi:hypothetical protein